MISRSQGVFNENYHLSLQLQKGGAAEATSAGGKQQKNEVTHDGGVKRGRMRRNKKEEGNNAKESFLHITRIRWLTDFRDISVLSHV